RASDRAHADGPPRRDRRPRRREPGIVVARRRAPRGFRRADDDGDDARAASARRVGHRGARTLSVIRSGEPVPPDRHGGRPAPMSRCWKETYFVLLDGVLEGELDEPLPVEGDVAEGDLLGSEDGDDDGDDGDVDGDADGARSLERSPVRPFGDSVQAVARIRTMASRPKPLIN